MLLSLSYNVCIPTAKEHEYIDDNKSFLCPHKRRKQFSPAIYWGQRMMLQTSMKCCSCTSICYMFVLLYYTINDIHKNIMLILLLWRKKNSLFYNTTKTSFITTSLWLNFTLFLLFVLLYVSLDSLLLVFFYNWVSIKCHYGNLLSNIAFTRT